MFGEGRMGTSTSHMDMRVRTSPSVKDLPQFPAFLKSTHKLHSAINRSAEHDSELKYKRKIAAAQNLAEAQWYDNFVRSVPEAPLPHKIDPVIPPKERYVTSSNWSEFVLHDMRGVVTTTIGTATSLSAIPERTSETEQLLNTGTIAAKKFANIDLPLRERINSIGTCIDQFSRHIDGVIASAPEYLQPYSAMVKDAKNTAKIWKMISRSALMLNGVKNQDYEQVTMWFKELQKTKVRVGDLFPVSAKRVEVISDPAIWKAKIDAGEKNILFCDQKLLESEVDGVTGIMLFNLVKNANVYKKSHIVISGNIGELVIENDLKKPMDASRLFEPGQPGEGGHTGYGLFTVRDIYGTLAGNDVICEPNVQSADHGLAARFIIKKPSHIKSPILGQ
jgi:hypothetical protein